MRIVGSVVHQGFAATVPQRKTTMIYEVTNIVHDTWVLGVQKRPKLRTSATLNLNHAPNDIPTVILKAIEGAWTVDSFDYQPRDRSQPKRTIKAGFDFEGLGIARSDPNRMLKWSQAMKAKRAA
jgi:hypothetical protein